ncbi:MAG: HTH domain-containing protein, partial [Clostridiaceae bacterium]|nr:HTH domain-containing protein [Clostridiaceae bacterium]
MQAKVLKRLIEVSPGYVSGEQLSCDLGVTRTSVWKYVKELKKEGYIIESSTKKGYRLLDLPDIISIGEIIHLLNTAVVGKEIRYLPKVDSTNNYAKKIA